MIIKLDVDSDLYKQIENLVKDGKYSDLYQFIKIAINNQLQEEKTGLSEDNESPVLHSLKTRTQKLLQDIHRNLSDIPLEKSELPSMPSLLIWSFYNRFFPVKIVIRQLASMVFEDKKWFKLNELQDEAYNYAERISNSLKEYEDEHNIQRNEKLSTGLPSSKSELKGLKGYKKKKREDKLVASKIRFQDQFVGRYIKNDSTFRGACFEMGLMGVKIENEQCYVSLTDLGRELALLENPILDHDNFEKAFSEDEVRFILDKIISRFKLENIVVKRILNELRTKSLIADGIDDIFSDEKKKYYQSLKINDSRIKLDLIIPERVATMGRLSELGIVNWEIDSKGKSIYSLNRASSNNLIN